MFSLRVRPTVAVFTPGTEPRAGSRHPTATFLTDSAYRGGVEAWAIHRTRATGARSAVLTLLPLPDQLLDRARQSRLEVDQLRPRRGHDDPDHAVAVKRAHLRLPLDPLLGRHLVAAGRLEILVRDAIDEVELGPTPDEQNLRRVHLGVDRQGNHRVLAQGPTLWSVLGSAHDDLRAVPGKDDRDIAGCAVLGDIGQAGHVASQQFLTDGSVQNLGDLVRLHSHSSRCRSRSIQRIVLVGRRSAATGRYLSCSANATMIPSGPRT